MKSRSTIVGEGQLDSERVAHLLEAAEAGRLTAHVWLETEIGVGQIDFFRGRVVGASIGPASGRAALTRMLTLNEGRYRVVREDVPEGPPLVPDVQWLLDERARRQTQWRWLCEQAPPLSSILALTPEGRRARSNLHGVDRLVLPLADGRRTLADVLTQSAIDPVDVLTSVVGAIEAGLLSETEQRRSLFPLSPKEHVPHSLPAAARVPHVDEEQTPRATQSRPFGAGASPGTQDPAKEQSRISTRPVIAVSSTESRHGKTPWDPEGFTGAKALARSPTPPGGALRVLPLSRSTPPSTGRHIGLYQPLLRIGGTTASVYVGRLTADHGVGRLLALKVQSSRAARDLAATEAVLARARLACRLSHPNLVKILATGQHQTRAYLVMDYIEGASLERLLTRAPQEATVRRVVATIVDALSGLHAMHELTDEQGLPLEPVHAETSPEGLLVGVDGRCRLMGLGTPLRDLAPGDQPRRGRPGFIAPEQLMDQSLDRRADVFTMGAVLWSALTGQRLFSGRSPQDTIRQVCHGVIAPPSQVGLRPPAAFDEVCLTALQRDREKRFPTAERMALALREAAAGADLLASADDVATWVRVAVGRELAQRRLLILDASRAMANRPTERDLFGERGHNEVPT
ncbi:MAG: protein kinase [Polyangiaceae bacterium]|nr:protein kinase [Polyangiaceae bacterium]